ncbi:MAG TPA: hypothetical protein VGD67_04830 [Pseudonocardiaceae bacterium]
MPDLTSAVDSARAGIGRYFTLVSALPATLLVMWHALLVASGAWSDPPDLRAAAARLADIGLTHVALLLAVSLALGVVLHPLQFAFVQFLEGYWGLGRLAQVIRQRWIWHQRSHIAALRDLEDSSALAIEEQNDLDPHGRTRSDDDVRERIAILSVGEEAERLTAEFPVQPDQIMPTRLGNVLRYYERNAGAPYGLDTVRVLPYISRVAAPGDMDYVNDQRSQLDLAVRMVIVSLLCCLSGVVFLGGHGLWLLAALIPYAAAYLSYRGAVVAAGEYGRSLAVVIAVNRFALYDRLRVTAPVDTRDERARNEILGYLLAYSTSDRNSVEYVGSAPPTDAGRAGGTR